MKPIDEKLQDVLFKTDQFPQRIARDKAFEASKSTLYRNLALLLDAKYFENPAVIYRYKYVVAGGNLGKRINEYKK